MWRRRRRAIDRDDEVVTERKGRVWSPAQAVALIAGIAAIAFGVAALVETGLDGSLKRPHEELWSFHHTPLLAIIEIGCGVLLVLAATSATVGRALMTLIGAAAVAFGLLVVLDAWPQKLHRWLGVHDRNGWLFVIVGGVVLLSALVLPTIVRPRRDVVRQGGSQRIHTAH